MTAPYPNLDPELATALAAMPKDENGNILDFSDVPALRARVYAAASQLPAPQPDPRVAIETVKAQRADGSTLDIVLFTPKELTGPLPALAWFHAGGQVLGAAHEDPVYCGALALAINGVVAAVDYRLAPETRAPGGAEDGYLGYTYLVEHAAELGINPARIGIAGASGGGAIAAAAALIVRDRGAATPCLLALLYPMLDDRNNLPSTYQVTNANGMMDRRQNEFLWRAVLGERFGQPDIDPYSAPARATELRNLPDTFIAAAEFDVFRDECVDFGRRLLAAGVSVELHVYPRAFHAWDRFAVGSRLANALERDWHDFVTRHLHG